MCMYSPHIGNQWQTPKSTQWTNEFYWSYLQKYGWWITYRSRNYSKTAASPKPSPAWVTAHRAVNLEHTAQSAGWSAGWRVSSPGASSRQFYWCLLLQGSLSGLRVFFAVWLVWEGLLAVFFAYSDRVRPSESGKFQELPETILNCVPCYICYLFL